MANVISKLFVVLGIDRREFDKGMTAVAQKLSMTKSELKMMMAAITILGGAMTAVFLATAKAAEEQRLSIARLNTVLGNMNIDTSKVGKGLETTFDNLRKQSNLSTDEIRDAFKQLVIISNDYSGSLQHLGLAMNFAAAYGIGLGTAVQIIGRLMTGDAGAIKTYTGNLYEMATASEILADLTKRLSGTQEELISPVKQLGQSMREFSAQAGQDVLPIINNLANALNWLINRHIEAAQSQAFANEMYQQGLLTWAEYAYHIGDFSSKLADYKAQTLDAASVTNNLADAVRNAISVFTSWTGMEFKWITVSGPNGGISGGWQPQITPRLPRGMNTQSMGRLGVGGGTVYNFYAPVVGERQLGNLARTQLLRTKRSNVNTGV